MNSYISRLSFVAEVAASAGVPLADARRLIRHAATSTGDPAEVTPAAALVGDDVAEHESLARLTLADGIRRIAAEVRNSLDFHLSSHGNVPVSRAVLTGPALDLPGFDLALGRETRPSARARRGCARHPGRRRTRPDEPVARRGGPLGFGGRAVRAVNLIPADQRRGAGGLAGRSGGIVYVLTGGLAVLVALGVVYALAVNSVASRKTELASVTRQVAVVNIEAQTLCPLCTDRRRGRREGARGAATLRSGATGRPP